jgi:phosphatidylglycerophosphate synthase
VLDSHLHPRLKPLLNVCAARLDRPASRRRRDLTGFAIGVLALPFLGLRWYGAALAAIVVNRLLDGLDGALARRRGLTDAGDFSISPRFSVLCPGAVWVYSRRSGAKRRGGGWLLFFYRHRQQLSRLCRAGGKHQIANPGYAHKSFYYLGD